MQIAMVAANFSAGEADQVRRSMAAWQRRGGLGHFEEKLKSGMRANGYTEEFVDRIYRQILGFGDYGFPESHAASFATLAYQSAWLKCHHPAAFCAGLLNSWPMGFYAPAQLIADARRHDVQFRPADVTVSDWDCTLERGDIDSDGKPTPVVRLGLRLLSGIGEAEGLALVQARSEAPFRSADDLANRARLTRRTLDALARGGALAALHGDRHRSRWAAAGVERLPGFLQGCSAMEQEVALPAPGEGSDIIEDYRSTGLTLRRHPLALLRPQLDRLRVQQASRLAQLPSGREVRVAGIVTHRQRPGTASGVMFMSLEDETGLSNLIVWPKVLEQQRQHLLASSLMIVAGELQNENGVINVVVRKARDYSRWLGGLRTESRDFQ